MKTCQISSDFLVRYFNSPEFLDALVLAADQTRKYGHESNFAVWREYENERTYVGNIESGSATLTRNEGSTIRKTERKTKTSLGSESTYPLISLHFHPRDDLFTVPTYDREGDGDLNVIKQCYEIVFPDIKTVHSICSADDNTIEILLIQQQREITEGYMSFLYSELMRGVESECDTDTFFVSGFLNRSGIYKSEVIHTDGKGFTEADNNKIGKFSFELPETFKSLKIQ